MLGVTQMKYLVITADDFGMASCVNDAIRACMKAGVVMSTNVMMNMPYAGEAVSIKRQFPFASVGLHYNFTVGHPLTGASTLTETSTLTGEEDAFHSCRTFRKLYHRGDIDENDIIKEMTAQYNRFIYLVGHAPDYWNSHENVHLDRKLYQLFRDTSLSFGIKVMRSNQRVYVTPSKKHDRKLLWMLLERAKRHTFRKWERSSALHGIHSPDGLLLCLQSSDKANIPHVLENIQFGKNEFAELVIHPATSTNCAYFGTLTDKRIEAYRLFADPEVAAVAQANGLQLCNFERECAVSQKAFA